MHLSSCVCVCFFSSSCFFSFFSFVVVVVVVLLYYLAVVVVVVVVLVLFLYHLFHLHFHHLLPIFHSSVFPPQPPFIYPVCACVCVGA